MYIDIGLYREGVVSILEVCRVVGFMGVGFVSLLRELEVFDEEFGDVFKMLFIWNDEDDFVGEVLVCEGVVFGGEMEGCM